LRFRLQWKLDIDFQRRHLVAPIHFHADLVTIDLDMLGDDGKDFLPQYRDKIGMFVRCPFMGEQNLQPFARLWRGSRFAEETKQAHAALLPKSLPRRPRFSDGTVIGTSSPARRRAASR